MKNYIENEEIVFSDSQKNVEISAVEFAAVGIASHALCLIDSAGILRILDENGQFQESQISKFSNPALIKAALITLVGGKVLNLNNKIYTLSRLGKELTKCVGLLSLPLIGYRKLFAKQTQILKDPTSARESDIDFAAVALASISFGANSLDPTLIEIFQSLKPKGTICDLGCGTAEKLLKLCKSTNSPGLGIEQNAQVIAESKKYTKENSRIEVIQGDVKNLKDVWEDVDIALMSFVSHDINPNGKCSKILRSFQRNFPRMRCLVIVDIVSLSEKLPTIMPGFDYVHGLQGIVPRNYEETIEVFKKAGYQVFQEIAVKDMPNTFIWILKPNGFAKLKEHAQKSKSSRK
jgi:ubiquinone/menaquinone biosynthesis C-methylase UbiE